MTTNPENLHNTAAEAAAEDGAHDSVSHEATLYAEPIFHVGAFTVTNSLLNSWLVIIIVLGVALAVKSRIREVPGKLQGVAELVVEAFLSIFDSVTGSRERSLRFFPLVFSFFLFILISNWMGLLPGVGSIGQIIEHGGGKMFVPYFRGGTADLNTTLAMAVIGVVASHIFGVAAVGAWGHLNKFINIKAILGIFTHIRKDWTVILVNPIKAFVGIVELIGEIAKVISLSFRLFGNIFAGEVLLATISAIFAFGLPLPFIFLEVIVGIVQATIFSMLILSYLTLNTEAEEH